MGWQVKIAITGHRPDKLGGYDWSNPTRQNLFRRLCDVLKLYPSSELIVGGALGFDTDAARSAVDQLTYKTMCAMAAQIVYVSSRNPQDTPEAVKMLHARNRFMVDHAEIVVAAWNGSRGGTSNCIDYAKSKRKEILVLDPNGETYIINKGKYLKDFHL